VGCISTLVALSPVGKISGAHTNPAVSFAFWRRGKMKAYALLGYVASQMLGALLGSLPLLLWDKMGSSIKYGSTVPGVHGLMPAFLGELGITAIFVALILIFTGSRKLRSYTPFISPFFYGLMVWAEGALSGCSANPARSFGPAMISGGYGYYWIYLVAPIASAILVAYLFNWMRIERFFPIEAARISHHDCYSPDCLKTS
jgi:aquaporin Z